MNRSRIRKRGISQINCGSVRRDGHLIREARSCTDRSECCSAQTAARGSAMYRRATLRRKTGIRIKAVSSAAITGANRATALRITSVLLMQKQRSSRKFNLCRNMSLNDEETFAAELMEQWQLKQEQFSTEDRKELVIAQNRFSELDSLI